MKKETQFDKIFKEIYKRIGNGVQIGMFDLSKITSAAKNAYANGFDVETAMMEAINKYRCN